MKLEVLISLFENMGIDFYTGVPDSQLKSLCNYLINNYGISDKHIIASNEGNAVGLAAGYYLSTGKIPCVYMQNSGIGNIVNPVASLLNNKVYSIPCLFVIGWRGEPNVKDEPQHIFQGEITLNLLEIMDINYIVIDNKATKEDLESKVIEFKELLNEGKSVAFVIKKDALTYEEKVVYKNEYTMLREDAIRCITEVSKSDIIISTTGKTSRELFEIRENGGQSHKYDFLTVGSMGHTSSIALEIALNKKNKRVWCIDGDGSLLMHMGSMALIGAKSPRNYIHVIINNEAHESVGGQPTIAKSLNLENIALGCGYKAVYSVSEISELKMILCDIENIQGPILIEVKCAIGSRGDLGRPTRTPIENKEEFMQYLRECD